MIKVLHIFNEYLPKTEVWAYHLLSATKSVQHEIIAKYYNDNVNEIGPELVKHCVEDNALRLTYDATSKKDILKKANLWTKTRSTPSFEKQIFEVVKRKDYDIVHFHFGTTAADCIEVLESLSCKKVVSFYGWDYIKAPKIEPRYVDLYKRLFAAADLLLVEGPAGRNSLVELRCNVDKVKFMPLGIHKVSATPKKKLKDKLRLVQIASFSEKKGQIYAVEALHMCIQAGMDVELTLVGDARDPSYKEKIESKIQAHSLEDKVKILSWINFDEISQFLNDYDVFIHPSCHATDGDCEGGAPVIILQAQANGLPILGTNHCDIPAQVSDQLTGFITEERDSGQLASSIQKLYRMTTEEYSKMSENAIQWVNEHFDYTVLGKRLGEIYSTLVI